MEQWFEGKVAFVTGGGDGIGKAAALLFARRGAVVAVSDIDEAKAVATADAIKAEGGRALSLQCDVADDGDVDAAIKATTNTFGRLDCAFNNAGVRLLDDDLWSEASTLKTIQINLLGVMRCIRYEVEVMLKSGGGTIVNTASLSAFVASRVAFMPSYVASKHGVVGATKSAALQYARQNIRVNALCPGTTRTTLVEKNASSSLKLRELLENHSPMGRMAAPEEMAEAAIWLCSEKSSYINGHALIADGGAYAE